MAKEIIVTIVTTRRKLQRFTFTVDDGSGPDMAVKEYYTRAYTAKRGALRQLDGRLYVKAVLPLEYGYSQIGTGREIIFKRKKN
jgi:hypothetical protein